MKISKKLSSGTESRWTPIHEAISGTHNSGSYAAEFFKPYSD